MQDLLSVLVRHIESVNGMKPRWGMVTFLYGALRHKVGRSKQR